VSRIAALLSHSTARPPPTTHIEIASAFCLTCTLSSDRSRRRRRRRRRHHRAKVPSLFCNSVTVNVKSHITFTSAGYLP
jgi:hypothetical protein